jgi:S-adenosylmethionine:diacylglycerol 3-amino-3-carboxypropyl transferase
MEIIEKDQDMIELAAIDKTLTDLKVRKKQLIQKMNRKPPLSYLYAMWVEFGTRYNRTKNEVYLERAKEYEAIAKEVHNVNLKTLMETKDCYYHPKRRNTILNKIK